MFNLLPNKFRELNLCNLQCTRVLTCSLLWDFHTGALVVLVCQNEEGCNCRNRNEFQLCAMKSVKKMFWCSRQKLSIQDQNYSLIKESNQWGMAMFVWLLLLHRGGRTQLCAESQTKAVWTLSCCRVGEKKLKVVLCTENKLDCIVKFLAHSLAKGSPVPAVF